MTACDGIVCLPIHNSEEPKREELTMNSKTWKIYLAGEIHTTWRDHLQLAASEANLPVEFSSPELDHDSSDNCGVTILGAEDNAFWKDRKGAGINAIRTKNLIADSDIVIIKFGEKYRQWNAAFDAGFAHALNIPLIVIHPPEYNHALKEIDAAANAVAETPEQVIEILKYIAG